jgi:hypothetical protein
MDSPLEVPGALQRAAPGQALHEGMMLLLPGVQDPPKNRSLHSTSSLQLVAQPINRGSLPPTL